MLNKTPFYLLPEQATSIYKQFKGLGNNFPHIKTFLDKSLLPWMTNQFNPSEDAKNKINEIIIASFNHKAGENLLRILLEITNHATPSDYEKIHDSYQNALNNDCKITALFAVKLLKTIPEAQQSIETWTIQSANKQDFRGLEEFIKNKMS